MIQQQEVVERAYAVLAMELEARTAGGAHFGSAGPCEPYCPVCACAQAYAELDACAFKSPDPDTRLEVLVCIQAAASQIIYETRFPQ